MPKFNYYIWALVETVTEPVVVSGDCQGTNTYEALQDLVSRRTCSINEVSDWGGVNLDTAESFHGAELV